MVIYESAADYVDSATSLKDKIQRLEAIITQLMTVALKAVETDNILEYSLDDGQTKIQTKYKGADQVLKSIKAYEDLKERYKMMLNNQGKRKVRLLDENNLRGYGRRR